MVEMKLHPSGFSFFSILDSCKLLCVHHVKYAKVCRCVLVNFNFLYIYEDKLNRLSCKSEFAKIG